VPGPGKTDTGGWGGSSWVESKNPLTEGRGNGGIAARRRRSGKPPEYSVKVLSARVADQVDQRYSPN